jgi:flagellar biogenesis protein FliO
VVLAAIAILGTIVDTNLWFAPKGETFSFQDKLIFNISIGLLFVINLFALIKYITKKIYNKESKKHLHN